MRLALARREKSQLKLKVLWLFNIAMGRSTIFNR